MLDPKRPIREADICVGAFLVTAAPYFDTRRDRIVGFAAQKLLPAIYQFPEYAV